MPERSFSIAAASPKPLMVTLAPSAASARAIARPMPDVEPVTSADLPFSMEIPNSMKDLSMKRPPMKDLEALGQEALGQYGAAGRMLRELPGMWGASCCSAI